MNSFEPVNRSPCLQEIGLKLSLTRGPLVLQRLAKTKLSGLDIRKGLGFSLGTAPPLINSWIIP